MLALPDISCRLDLRDALHSLPFISRAPVFVVSEHPQLDGRCNQPDKIRGCWRIGGRQSGSKCGFVGNQQLISGERSSR